MSKSFFSKTIPVTLCLSGKLQLSSIVRKTYPNSSSPKLFKASACTKYRCLDIKLHYLWHSILLTCVVILPVNCFLPGQWFAPHFLAQKKYSKRTIPSEELDEVHLEETNILRKHSKRVVNGKANAFWNAKLLLFCNKFDHDKDESR